MDKKRNESAEGKDRFELDVDRMINEGMAGGRPRSSYGHEQIGEVHPIPEEDEK
ncbi:hypothetical protein LF817_18275 [Halobacillus sp. A1]|uniref:hypothetical protein n=1 Tax=Halobacillus sp. A1 TaxID=2880262 RepID=UPI0020A655A2|nr:hypothetical protein [Halobacillus sp. A1]MCP3033276.1 hypothetical protein [Halobacillus sp. A1]